MMHLVKQTGGTSVIQYSFSGHFCPFYFTYIKKIDLSLNLLSQIIVQTFENHTFIVPTKANLLFSFLGSNLYFCVLG